jgi:hypothetical protein
MLFVLSYIRVISEEGLNLLVDGGTGKSAMIRATLCALGRRLEYFRLGMEGRTKPKLRNEDGDVDISERPRRGDKRATCACSLRIFSG